MPSNVIVSLLVLHGSVIVSHYTLLLLNNDTRTAPYAHCLQTVQHFDVQLELVTTTGLLRRGTWFTQLRAGALTEEHAAAAFLAKFPNVLHDQTPMQ